MAYSNIKSWLGDELQNMRSLGLFKEEIVIRSSQGPLVDTQLGQLINLCANNYLGLADHPEIKNAVSDALETHGFGLASVRFICGTQDIHKDLERKLTDFFGTEDTILYNSCFDANAGLFETILSSEDVVISDSLNHASIIDGIRLCRSGKKVFTHADMEDLELKLKESQSARFRLIVTDGVFSMQGDIARLSEICALADKYDSLVMVDDSHATGFIGPNGKGTPEELGVSDRIDILTSTFGKALGGASGGFTTGRKEIVDYLRQRSRPYIFSNTLAPPIVAGTMKALDLIQSDPNLRRVLLDNAKYFRQKMTDIGFNIIPGIHPVVPIMIGDELTTTEMARLINEKNVFVVGFRFPVVPKGEARIRVQLSATHTRDQLDKAISVFHEVGVDIGLI